MQPGSKLSRAQTWKSREHQRSKQNSQEPALRVRRFQRAINPRASPEFCSTARQNDKTYVLLNFHGAVRLWAKLHAENYRKNMERWRYRLPKYLTVHKGLRNCSFKQSNFCNFEWLPDLMSGIAYESITHTLIQLTKFHHANCWLLNGSRDEILLQCQAIERPEGNLNQRITLRDKFDLSHQKLFRRKLIAVANATGSTVENKKLISMQTPLKPGWKIKCGLQPRVTTERFLKFS